MNNDLIYWVWLNSLVKISTGKRYELLKHFTEPSHIWHSDIKELEKLPFLTKQIIDHLSDKQLRKDAERHLHKALSAGMSIVTLNNKSYPVYLKNIYDPPVLLFVKGKLSAEEPCVAVVGSRRASSYGLDMAETISRELSKAGLTVVSGMARGIDSRAHKGALAAGGRTIAVLGCGLDIVYPYENLDLMKNICNNGAVVSEFLPGVPPISFNFPARNRLISGISKGVVVIEASEKSGSLITANYALDQGRDVFAVPGNINSCNSAGTNRLIRDGAKIVTGINDILDELNVNHAANNKFYNESSILRGNFNKDELSVAKRLAKGPVHIDEIARDCGFSVQLTGSILIMLELNGFVEQLPGKFFKLAII